uniref:Uncharacterized protein n=1 Tax=Romanomermis culicivorax TaxID=13658 RepID=A0A915JMD0_ROMCU
MALRQFPVANNRLYNLLPPEECPAPASKCYIDKECYVPTKLIDVEPDPDRCITFPAAMEMLNAKDNGSPTWQKNDYLAVTTTAEESRFYSAYGFHGVSPCHTSPDSVGRPRPSSD